MEFNIAATIVCNMLDFAAKRGLEPTYLCERIGLSMQATQQSNQFINFESAIRLWEILENDLKDEHVGLHAGEYFNLAALGIIGSLTQHSPDVATALKKACEYSSLFGNAYSIHMEVLNHSFRIYCDIDPNVQKMYGSALKHLIDTTLVFTLKEAQILADPTLSPVKASFSHEAGVMSNYHCIFGHTELLFNQPLNFLEYESSILHKKVKYADQEVLTVLEQVARKRMQEIKQDSYANNVEAIILSQMNTSFPDLNKTASIMNTSPRTLQRKLQNENVTYQDLVTNIRKNLATQYLKKGLTYGQISLLLGYAEESVFVKAFKNWYGMTPGVYKVRQSKTNNG